MVLRKTSHLGHLLLAAFGVEMVGHLGDGGELDAVIAGEGDAAKGGLHVVSAEEY